ncbi:HK97 family phage prohead protease [Enterococcus sp. AZ102]|uniref:HK97 family phage prohead protease n=1 Tax=Enterococcus sp. AZ102 TaxID=2774865 RepID=UPI003F1ED04C
MTEEFNRSKITQSNEELEIRSLQTDDSDEKIIEGYAITFNNQSKKLGSFYEVIDSRALDNVDLSDVKCLLDHDYSKVLGRTKSKTLELSVDEKGLKFRCVLPRTSYAEDLYELVNRLDVNECSFGFTVNEKDKSAQTVKRLSDGSYLRTVNKIDTLYEISIVSLPAYNNTSAEIKRDFDNAIATYEKEKISLQLELLDY